MLFATRKAVSFNDNLEKCVLAWGTTEPIIVGRIEIGMSPLRMGDECIYENYWFDTTCEGFFISLDDNINNIDINIFMDFIKISPLPKHNEFDRGKKFTFIAEVLNSLSYGVM